MVKIVTDASVRFPNPEFMRRRDIVITPLTVRCGSVQVSDNPEQDLTEIRPYLEGCTPDLYVESPSVEQMDELYTRLGRETNQILSIHTSSSLTQTYQNAVQASQLHRGRLDIQVIDSESISVGLGFLVEESVRATERGENLDTLVRMVRGLIARLYMVLFLDDLFFLEHSQLVSRSQAILGNMLGVIPFLTMEEGQMIPMEKVRSRPRAVEKLIEFVCEFSGLEQLGLFQGGLQLTEETLLVQERLHTLYPMTPISTVCYGPTLAAYIGFNSLGAIVLESKSDSL